MRNNLLLWLLLLGCGASALAQGRRTVAGTVRDAANAAVVGASVRVKGGTTGATTDAEGAFRLQLTTDSPVLVVSAVGFETQEVTVGNATQLAVVLKDDQKLLSEVVVTGFGIKQEARKLSYAIQEVKGQELVRTNNANVVNALQGKIAGVQIDQGTGGPMSSSRIRIRGNASLSPNTQPLFVIDGVLIRPATTGADSWGAAQDFGNIMKNINPDNIETMSVLKGSAASSLYGSEALNGVVVITTKQGRPRQGLGVTYNHTSSFENAFRFLDVQNQFGGGLSPTFPRATDGTERVDPNGWNYSYGPALDGRMVRDLDGRMIPWVANDPLKFFQTGQFINHNLAVEGGNDRGSFRASVSRLNNTTVMPAGTQLKRTNFNLRATQKVGSIINLDVSADYTNNDMVNPIRQGGNFNPVFRLVFNRPRTLDIDYWMNNYTSPNGGRRQGADDPYAITSFLWETFQRTVTRNEKVFRGNIDITTTIRPWLSLLVRANLQNELYQNEGRNLGDGPGFAGNDEFRQSSVSQSQSRVQSLLTASKSLGRDFHLNLTFGGETNRLIGGRNFEYFTNGGLRLPGVFSLANARNGIQPGATRLNPSRRTDAIYAYGDLSFKDALFLNFSNRIDYSSTLTYADGSGQHTYSYPSVGLAWDFTQSFQSLPAALSFGKVRASYGFTGGDTDPWITNQTGFYGPLDNFTSTTGIVPRYGFSDNTLPNYGLRNRLAREWELGADLRFFNNRLGIDVAVYNKQTTNEIFRLPAAPESGVGSRLVNAGRILNRGVELMINATPVKGERFQWNTTLNFSRNRNKILELAEGITTYDLNLAFGADVRSVAKVGGDYGTILTPYAFATYQRRDAGGNPVDHPSNGQRVIGAASGTTNGNLTFLRSGAYGQGAKEVGTMLERFLLSNINNFRYRNFSATAQVDAKIGGVMASATHQYGSQTGSLKNSLFGRNTELGGVTFTDAQGITRNDGIIPDGVLADGVRVTVDGRSIDLGGLTYAEAVSRGYLKPVPAFAYYENLSQWSSGIREYSIFENSWVSLREVSVGYDVPSSLLSRVKVQSLRVSLVGRNLTYLYRTAKDGINPEGLKSNNAGEFAEYGGLPFTRTVGVSLNLGL